MLKALFLDLDETLCDTTGANERAKTLMADYVTKQFGQDTIDGNKFADQYLTGIYRLWTDEQHHRYMPIIEEQSEEAFRIQLIQDLLAAFDIDAIDVHFAKALQDKFDDDRIQAFDFFPGITEFLAKARETLTLVVITNGPEFSQIPKVNRVELHKHVDHIIIGGQEPEEKPAISIFNKALSLSGCEAHEVIHVGDSLGSDILGAQNSGIRSIWVNHADVKPSADIAPHYVISHPAQLSDLIFSIHKR
jgi:HAD superfamily hydrolase (TIGR01549 family)